MKQCLILPCTSVVDSFEANSVPALFLDGLSFTVSVINVRLYIQRRALMEMWYARLCMFKIIAGERGPQKKKCKNVFSFAIKSYLDVIEA